MHVYVGEGRYVWCRHEGVYTGGVRWAPTFSLVLRKRADHTPPPSPALGPPPRRLSGLAPGDGRAVGGSGTYGQTTRYRAAKRGRRGSLGRRTGTGPLRATWFSPPPTPPPTAGSASKGPPRRPGRGSPRGGGCPRRPSAPEPRRARASDAEPGPPRFLLLTRRHACGRARRHRPLPPDAHWLARTLLRAHTDTRD